ncbi:hypothetical protein [Aquimarina hainanensis]
MEFLPEFIKSFLLHLIFCFKSNCYEKGSKLLNSDKIVTSILSEFKKVKT